MSTPVLDEELVAAFREEATDALDAILRLRDEWDTVADVDVERKVLEAFRAFHNMKGAARLVGFVTVEPLAHVAEDLLRAFNTQHVRPERAVIELLARAASGVLGHAEGRTSVEELDELTSALGAHPLASPAPPVTGDPAANVVPKGAAGEFDAREREGATQVASRTSADAPTAFVDAAAVRPGEFVRVRADHLDQLVATTAELLTYHARVDVRETRLEELGEDFSGLLRGLPPELQKSSAALFARLDRLIVEGRTDVQRVGQLAGEVGEAVRRTRMFPLSGSIAAWRRIAEDTAQELGKQVRFEADVGDVVLDRKVLDALRDPMMHLLRNAIDHGLETPAERLAAGKPAAGRVSIRSTMVSTVVTLTVQDDGRGIDVAAVVAGAVGRGILTSELASTQTELDALDLVFAAGLSTATEVTRISGRGIGLDVVRSRLRDFGGDVVIASTGPIGTTFRLEVPVDVVQTSALLVRVGTMTVAIPMRQVERAIRIVTQTLRESDGGTMAAFEEADPIHIVWLGSIMGEERTADGEHISTVVVRQGQRRVGLVVDEVLGDAAFVLRPLPWNLLHVPAVAGAAVLGDGTIALVLDLAELLPSSSRDSRRRVSNRPSDPRRAARTILVVDDSGTSRLLLRNILSTAGYEVLVADDGEEAWAILARARVDLVVTDVQMPRLDGHALTRRIRADPRTEDLPVIMVTSLARPEDIELGAAAGADEYIVKGRFDHRTVLEAVERLC
jgi:two-component system chemotaxis sensor kinase CheA